MKSIKTQKESVWNETLRGPVIVYVFGFIIFCAFSAERLLEHSSDNHYVHLANGMLHGRLHIEGAPPHFNDWAKYYQKDTIYADDYKWLENDIPTFSVKTLLIVNEAKLSDQDRKDLAIIVEGIKANMTKLKTDGHHKWNKVDLSDWDSTNWPLYK